MKPEQTPFDLSVYLTQKRAVIDQALEGVFQNAAHVRFRGRLTEAMHYSLMAGGKRLRPILCLAAAESLGGYSEDCLKVACAIEMIHTYSLIHDDLPAMDDDTLRRGWATCHVKFNEATAILAGDALLTLAFQLLATIPAVHGLDTQYYMKWLAVMRCIADAAGLNGMIQGQMIDIASEGKSLSLDALKELHQLKTGALIEASIEAGAIMAGADPAALAPFKSYATHIGLAFQVTDDILNVEGNAALMGKSVGTDAQRRKASYPALMGVTASKAYARELIQNAMAALNPFDDRAEPLKRLAAYIIERKK